MGLPAVLSLIGTVGAGAAAAGVFGGQDSPDPIDIPDREDPDVQAAASRERRRASLARGRRATILGGAVDESTTGRTLLGQ